jgi:hypothetical protein
MRFSEATMRFVRFGAGVMALVLGAGPLGAQQPGPPQRQPPPQQEHRQRAGMSNQPDTPSQMRMMDSLDTRLDSLVIRMNRAVGSEKVAAMAAVINELVAQRKAMQEHMREMMGRRQGMMHMMEDSTPASPPSPGTPAPAGDSATADSAGHAGHHPPR